MRKTLTKFSATSIILILFCILVPFVYVVMPENFRETKILLTRFYKIGGLDRDFYCNAPFEFTDKNIKIIPSDSYTPRNEYTKKGAINQRATIIEFEHIMPAYNFGQHLECWRKGGRKACARDPIFSKIEADPYNLVPAVGEINADRNNFRYAQMPKNLIPNQYGNCPVYTDFAAKRFYPAPYSRGLIARTYLYMSDKYNIRLSDQERSLMQAWDKMYPPNDYEKKRNRIIKFALWFNGMTELLKLLKIY